MQKNIEYLNPDEWGQFHTELLQSAVNRIYSRVPFYKKAMDVAGLTPGDINTTEDIHKLPFTTRKDLSQNYPYAFFAVPLRDVVRIHTLRSAQTNPIVIGYAKQDIEHRLQLTSRFLTACDIDEDAVIQICLEPAMSVWSQELKEGAEYMGALVIPPDPVSLSSRLKVLADFKTSVLITTPSYGRFLFQRLKEQNIPLPSLSLKKTIFVGEYLNEKDRNELEDYLGIKIYTAYGVLEAMGPAMAYECPERNGLHLAMDHLIPEIIDPDTRSVLSHGETGELVISTVTTRGNPLLRFRTGDITKLMSDRCRCGRTTWRIAPVQFRCDGLISIRGVKINTELLDAFITSYFGKICPKFILVVKTVKQIQQVELWIAMMEKLFSGSLPDIHDLLSKLALAFEETVGLPCRVTPVEEKTIEPYLSKGKKIIDLSE